MFSLRESEASATNVLSVRKRSVSDKSAQPERKSATPYGDELFEWSFLIKYPGNAAEKEGQLYREIECKFRGGW